ncbi:MAG: hypothetical protein ACR2RL_05120 [Gammaproteobacteria bacterium]
MKTPRKRGEPSEFWEVLESRLTGQDEPEEPVSQAEIEALLQEYPRRTGEVLEDWIHRVCRPASAHGQAAANGHRPQRIQWLTECERLAADTSGAATLPHAPLLSSDGQFQLEISRAGDQLALSVQALGFAAVDLAHRQIVIARSREAETPLVTMTLNEEGEARCLLADDAHTRASLVHPVIGLVECGTQAASE